MSKGLRDQIEAYLLDSQFDSSGSFSENTHRHRQLRGLAFLDRSLWVVKLLQAAVAWGAPALCLTQGRDYVRAHFSPTSEPSGARPWQEQSRGSGYFSEALQIVSTDPGQEVEILFKGKAYRVVDGEAQPQDNLTPETAKDKIQVTSRFRSHAWYRLDQTYLRRQQQIHEVAMLTDLGRFSPIRVLVDGRLLNDPVPHKAPGLSFVAVIDNFTPRPAFPYSAVEKALWSGDGDNGETMAFVNLGQRLPRLRYRRGIALQQSDRGFHGFLQMFEGGTQENWGDQLIEFQKNPLAFSEFRSELPSTRLHDQLTTIRLHAYLSCDLNSEREGRLYLIQDGVLLKPKILPPKLDRCLALWVAPQVSVDLSLMEVIENEVYQRLLCQIQGHFQDMARQFLECYHSYGGERFHLEFAEELERTERWALAILQ